MFNPFDHNPHHYTTIKGHRFCSRCLGTFIAGVLSFLIFGIIYLQGIQGELATVFILSWILASICVFDWLTVKLNIRDETNKQRIIAGAFLGVAYSLYFWMLPVDWPVKIISISIIQLTFAFIVYIVRCKINNISIFKPLDLVQKMLEDRKLIYQCACPTCTCCPCDWCSNWIYGLMILMCCCGVCCALCACGVCGSGAGLVKAKV